MDIKLLKSDIKSNAIPKFLIFLEEEPMVCRQYIHAISNTVNKYYKYYDSADAILYDINTNLKEDFVYVVRNDKKIINNLEYIKQLINTNKYVIVIFDEIDNNSSFYKTYKEYIVPFLKIDKLSLLAYAEKMMRDAKINVSQDKLLQMIEYTDCDFGILKNELEKITLLEQENSDILMDYMLNNGFSDYRKINMQSIINKILVKDLSALELLTKFSDSPVSLIYSLYFSSRNALLKTKNNYYADLMQLCYELYNGIIDGTCGAEYSLKYLMYKVSETI